MNLFDKLFVGDKSFFDIPLAEQKRYLDKLGDAKNDYERSYKQYKGQSFYMTLKKRIALSVLSFFSFILLFPVYVVNGLFLKKSRKIDAISRAQESEQFIPTTLINKYKIDRNVWKTKGALFFKDIPFTLLLCLKYFWHPYLLLKIVFKIAKYSAIINKYHPEAIIVNDEFSFTSSVLTLFCEHHNVKHINVQHGEKLFILRDSFFRFTESYIWDEYYKQLFISLKAEPGQFIIDLPESMKFDLKEHYSQRSFSDFKYYLGVYTEEEIVSIVKSMSFAKQTGKTVKFRPHPNYSDIELLKKYVAEDEIELPSVNILESISSTKYVVGVYSTVLTQAYFNGQNVIIDDISFKNQYDALRDLKYILIDKVENRLSEFQIV